MTDDDVRELLAILDRLDKGWRCTTPDALYAVQIARPLAEAWLRVDKASREHEVSGYHCCCATTRRALLGESHDA